MQMQALPRPSELPAPVRMTGIGNSHLHVSATPEAQQWFDQGLNLLHDFWDYEAARAFEQGLRVDQHCAMCSWGLHQALTFRSEEATLDSEQALAAAVAQRSHLSRQERLYIDAAVAKRDAERKATGGGKPDHTRETAIWRRLVAAYPGDLQAKLFLASSLHDGFDDQDEPKPGTREAIAILEGVLRKSPEDSAANHYWIHAMEPGQHPERALHSAQVLASLAPASGHMVHMPGHIFYRTGDYAQAEPWFTASTNTDEHYMQAQHVAVDNDWNYTHNLMYAIANLMEEGKMEHALALSGKLAGARGQFAATLYPQVPRDGYTRLNAQLPLALRTGDWPRVLSLLQEAHPDDKLANLNLAARNLQQFATGMQAVQSGDLAAALASSDQLDASLWRLQQKVKDTPEPKPEPPTAPPRAAVMPDAQPAPLLGNLSIMSLELRAAILAAQKQLVKAKELFAQAALEEKKLGYREPPLYIRPVGEAEGFALLQAGDAAGAHAAYARALVARPRAGLSLYGLARSSEAAGDAAAAHAEYAEFLKAWKSSDPDMPERQHAASYLQHQLDRVSALPGSR